MIGRVDAGPGRHIILEVMPPRVREIVEGLIARVGAEETYNLLQVAKILTAWALIGNDFGMPAQVLGKLLTETEITIYSRGPYDRKAVLMLVSEMIESEQVRRGEKPRG